MTSHELAHKLLSMPDAMVTVRGYEGGVDTITSVSEPKIIHLNVNDAWYYGRHEYHGDHCVRDKDGIPTTIAIHLD